MLSDALDNLHSQIGGLDSWAETARQAFSFSRDDNPQVYGAIDAAKQNLGGLEAIGAFFAGLTNPETYVRTIIVILGLVLLFAAIFYFMGGDKVVMAAATKGMV